jgi:hypothetical protein
MHSLYFVSLPKQDAESPQEAIDAAESFLAGNSFVYSGGLWGGGKCDWYEIGGRWSGLFTELLMPKDKHDAYLADIKAIEDEHDKAWKQGSAKAPSDEWDNERERMNAAREEQIMAAWKKHFPDSQVLPPEACKGTFSFTAVAQNFHRRYDTDDALLMTSELWAKLIEYLRPSAEGQSAEIWDAPTEVVYTDEYDERELVSIPPEEAIGRWWVIVDYHY